MKKSFIAFSISLFSILSFAQKNPYDVVIKPSKITPESNSDRSEFVKQFPFLNIVDWKPGMKFMTEPLRDLTFSAYSKIGLSPYKSNSYNSHLSQSDFQWKIFIYKGLEQRDVNCPRGICQRTYLVFECDSEKYEFEFIGGDTTELRKTEVFNSIDKLVYLDEVDKVKELLVGKILYIMTQGWMRDNENGEGRIIFSNPKFIAVTVTSIGLGNQDGPSKVVFKQNGNENEAYLNIRLSGINKASGVFGEDFDQVFKFTDPKLKYPNITKDIWNYIQNGKVKIGMTKQECELSWGKPKNINKTTIASGNSEQWVYGSSSYLYFENHLLKAIQN